MTAFSGSSTPSEVVYEDTRQRPREFLIAALIHVVRIAKTSILVRRTAVIDESHSMLPTGVSDARNAGTMSHRVVGVMILNVSIRNRNHDDESASNAESIA